MLKLHVHKDVRPKTQDIHTNQFIKVLSSHIVLVRHTSTHDGLRLDIVRLTGVVPLAQLTGRHHEVFPSPDILHAYWRLFPHNYRKKAFFSYVGEIVPAIVR